MSNGKINFDEAWDKYRDGDRSQEVVNAILQDAYEFLESENYHTHIEIIEELTGIKYD